MRKYLTITLILSVGILTGYFLNNYNIKKSNNLNSLNTNQNNNQNDPLGLFSDTNNMLNECLNKNNPEDPLGIINETESQKLQRENCINKFSK